MGRGKEGQSRVKGASFWCAKSTLSFFLDSSYVIRFRELMLVKRRGWQKGGRYKVLARATWIQLQSEIASSEQTVRELGMLPAARDPPWESGNAEMTKRRWNREGL